MSSTSILNVIQHYQRSIEHSQDDEGRLLHCINKLYRLPVKVEHLQETGVGKTVNSLRKYNGEIGVAAKALVTKWKAMVAAEEEPIETNNSENNDDNDDNANNGNGNDSSDKDNGNSHHNHKSSTKEHRDVNATSGSSSKEHHRHKNQISSEHKSKSHREEKSNKSSNEHSTSKHKRHKETEENSMPSEKRIKYDEHVTENKTRENNHRHKSERNEKQQSSSRDGKATSSQTSNHHKNGGESKERKDNHQRDENRSDHKSSSKNAETTNKHSESEKTRSPKEKDRKERSKENKQKDSSHRNKQHKSSTSHSSATPTITEQLTSSSTNIKPDSTNSSSSGVKRKRHHDSESNEASPSKSKVAKTPKSPKQKTTTANETASEIDDNGIDSSMGANFADVLGMLNMPTKKSKKGLNTNKSPTVNAPSRNTTTEKASCSSSTSKDNKTEYKPSSITSTSSKPIDTKPDLLTSSAKLAPLDPSIALELPTISANYKPLPHNKTVMDCIYRNSGPVNNTPKPPVRTLTDAEAITHGISSKTMRTKIYSGVKTGQVFQVPSLFDLCIRILQKNIDALEYTGGVPFEVLRPVLERATPYQLLTFEEYNPYLMEDSDCLWQIHVQRNFRSKKREEMESWREMFLRCEEEKERKLNSLTETIKKSQKIIAAPVRKTQLAFVDSMVKPPRSVLRKQEQFGTREKLVATPASRVASLSSVTPNAAKVGDTRLRVAATVRDTAQAAAPARPKKAPLMAKTLQFIRGRHKR